MASIEEVKAGLAQAAEESHEAVAQARAASESAERALQRLQAVAQGTNHPKVQEAMQRAQQCRQLLQQAAQLAQASAQAARDYTAVLG